MMHFIGGLPRSGSTLLAAILRQNPRITAGRGSPMYKVWTNIVEALAANNQFAGNVSGEQRLAILRASMEAFYPDADIVFDTNRGWANVHQLIGQAYPEATLFCMVRSMPWIIDSLERQQRTLEPTSITRFKADYTVYQRANTVAANDGVVGYVLDGLKGACAAGAKVVLIRYESLTAKPLKVIRKLYDHIGVTQFAHDFKNVEFIDDALDARIGAADMHTVRPIVEPNVRETILPADLFERFEGDNFWNDLDTEVW